MTAGDPDFEDLTARARIRDAALRLFAQRGIDAATVRDIAKAAGVSAGLVRHHFGSKEGLRDACDRYALERVVQIKERAILDGQLANPAFLPAAQPTLLLLWRYFARSMVDGTPAAAALFDEMVEVTEQWLARYAPHITSDPRAYAGVLVSMQAGLLVMHPHLSRVMGGDILTPAGHRRMSRAALDFYTHPLVDPEMAARAQAALDAIQAQIQAQQPPSTPAEQPSAPLKEYHDDRGDPH